MLESSRLPANLDGLAASRTPRRWEQDSSLDGLLWEDAKLHQDGRRARTCARHLSGAVAARHADRSLPPTQRCESPDQPPDYCRQLCTWSAAPGQTHRADSRGDRAAQAWHAALPPAETLLQTAVRDDRAGDRRSVESAAARISMPHGSARSNGSAAACPGSGSGRCGCSTFWPMDNSGD